MRAAWIEQARLRVCEQPAPRLAGEWALVDVAQAGVCGTDLALAGGLYGFRGIPGHEFVGRVIRGPSSWVGQRVVADINVACGSCRYCRDALPKHCIRRRVIGIRGLGGAFAQLLAVPERNLHGVPDSLDDDAAVFAEPLAAALHASHELPPAGAVLVVGPGRLGQLVARVLSAQGRRVCCLGRSAPALARLPREVEAEQELPHAWRSRFGAVVDCSGSAAGTQAALSATRPRGTLVLKGTSGSDTALDLGRAVVDEIRIVGSRCGPLAEAVEWLDSRRIDPRSLIDEIFGLDHIETAFANAAAAGRMKVLVRPESGRAGA